MKTLISNGKIISMDPDYPQVFTGDIAVENKKILSVGNIPSDFHPDKIINAENSIVLPGLINAHTHLSMVLLRSYADDMDLQKWLNEKIWPIEEKMTPDQIYNSSLLGAAELIKSGVTAFADMYFFQHKTCEAVRQSGIRARIGASFFGNEKDVAEKLPYFQELYDTWNGKADGRIHIDAAPHSAYTLTTGALKMAVDFAKKNNTRIHTHVSESRKETEDNYKQYGISPVEYMENTGVFDLPAYAAHCVQLNNKDLEIIKKHHVFPVHNPTSNLKLGNGIAPVPQMMEAGIITALGTDGASSNNNLNMFEEIHLAAIIHKGNTGDPTSVSAYQSLKMATLNGAEALGIDSVCGSLTPGKEADIILVDTEKIHLQPLYDPVSAIAYGSQASDVHLVMCAGEILMEKGRLKTINEEEIMKIVKTDSKKLTGS